MNEQEIATVAWEYVKALAHLGKRKKVIAPEVFILLNDADEPVGTYLKNGFCLSDESVASMVETYGLTPAQANSMAPLLGAPSATTMNAAASVDLSSINLTDLGQKAEQKTTAEVTAKGTEKFGLDYLKMGASQKTLCAVLTVNEKDNTSAGTILAKISEGKWEEALAESTTMISSRIDGDGLESKIARELLKSTKKELENPPKKKEETKKGAKAASAKNDQESATVVWQPVMALAHLGKRKKIVAPEVFLLLNNVDEPVGTFLKNGFCLSDESVASMVETHGLTPAQANSMAPLLGAPSSATINAAASVDLSSINLTELGQKAEQKTVAEVTAKGTAKFGLDYLKMGAFQKTLCAVLTVNEKDIKSAGAILTKISEGKWEDALAESTTMISSRIDGDGLDSKIARELLKSAKKELENQAKKKEEAKKEAEEAEAKKAKAEAKKNEEEKKSATAAQAKIDKEEAEEEAESAPKSSITEVAEDPEADIEDLEEKIEFTGKNEPVDEIVEACPTKSKKTEEKKEETDKTCEFAKLSADKDGRNFAIKWATGAGDDHESLYEIVAGHTKKPATVKLKMIGLTTNCETHEERHWDVETKPFNGADRDLKCVSNKSKSIKNSLWAYSVAPKVYKAKGTTCKTSHTVVVRVYPDTHYKINLNWNLEVANLLKSIKSPKLTLTSTMKLDGVTRELKVDNAGVNYKVEGGNEVEQDVGQRIAKAAAAILQLKEATSKLVSDLASKDAKPDPPFKLKTSFDLSFEWGWQEKKDSPMCEFICEGALTAKPFMELDWKKEFIGKAVLSMPVVGTFIYATKKLIDHLDAGELSLKFGVKGDLGFVFGHTVWVFSELKEEVTFTPAKVSGGISISLEGVLKAEVKTSFLGIKAGAAAGVTIGAEAGFKLGEKSGIYMAKTGTTVDIALTFTGLCVYAKAFFTAGISMKVEGELPVSAAARLPAEDTTEAKGPTISAEGSANVKKEADKKGFIIDPKENFWSHSFKLS